MSSNISLPSIWPWETLDSVKALGRSVVSGPFGSNIGKRFFVDQGVPVIRGNNLSLSMTQFSDRGFVYLTEEKSAEFKNCEAHPGDLIFTAAGTIGQVGLIPAKPIYKKYIISNKQLRARLDIERVLPLFAYYWFTSPIMVAMIQSRNTGSTIPLINLSVLKSLPIPLPPLTIQLEIANFLGALDDRITLLRETNATLEAIAQAMFKSWFIDFDPVRAKQEGREPEGMDAATAALFPSNFEESELGLVPTGWRVGNLGDNTIYLNRGISPKYLECGGILVINQKCIRDFILDLEKSRRHDIAQRKIDGRELLIGDVLVNSTGVGTLGRVAQVLSIDEPMIVDSHVTVVRAGDNLTWNYLGLSMMQRQSEIEDLGEGTTGQTELSRMKLAILKLVLPPQTVLNKFDQITLPLRQKFSDNLKQAQTLATLRDTLLPRLISGQLRLPEADAIIEKAAA